ncbi:MAG: hypothetical protein ABR552_09040 [Actinomycetota bacterium]
MIPLPQIIAELIMALGGALFAGSAWALIGPRFRGGPGPSARGRLIVNVFIGLVVLVWGFASFITHNAGKT